MHGKSRVEAPSPQPNVPVSSWRTLPPLFWLLLIATGALAGVGGGLLMLLLRAVQHLVWPYRPGDNFLSAVENAQPLWIVFALSGAGLLAGLSALVLQRKKSANGGELAARIWFDAGKLNPFPTLVRAILSIIIVAMGASLGREAAPKQTGALAASILAQWAGIPPVQRRLLAACGAGAGMAAVYNVPFGGALFALEVLLGTLSLTVVPPALIASMIATAVSWLFLPNEPTYTLPAYPVTLDQTVWAVLTSPVAGLVSVAYVRLISFADAKKPGGILALIAPVVVLAALGGLAVRYPQLLGNGKDVVQQTLLGQPGLALVAALVFLKPLSTAACLGSGAPGGLFTPTMTLGALLGGVLGILWHWVWPGAPLGGFSVIGACAVLAASTQGPISAIVLTWELTRQDSLIVPTVLAAAGAVAVARLLENRSIYSGRIYVARSPVSRPALPEACMTVSQAASYLDVLKALAACGKSQSVFVINEAGEVVGEISASRTANPPPELLPLETASAADFAIPYSPISADHAVPR